MMDRPILFSGPMVRAILEGRKWQTRRVVKVQPGLSCVIEEGMPGESPFMYSALGGAGPGHEVTETRTPCVCPYGQVGDRLWVRETFKAIASGEVKDGYGEVRYGFAYQADSATIWQPKPTIVHDLTGQPATGPMQFRPLPWKPSIHMPRRASRITLEITGVRVERLQDISEADAVAEGCMADPCDHVRRSCEEIGCFGPHATGAFRHLWQSINGPESWQANPWVWCISFRRIDAS